ncbi:VWA domain-containing protein [Alteromonas sp. ASW11-36]|uniref:VWA domain-containing protein n=1 Tax=Alteromonas arenosi TaxID=3055817 RepID=A0ABT7T1F2_9ALTE|nr:VWA domain-containing protein [Alteromonas sp. ASW11-36]MDM7861629.1 VWA domain-containing protein [Alteromonas sp. ASW11-36]
MNLPVRIKPAFQWALIGTTIVAISACHYHSVSEEELAAERSRVAAEQAQARQATASRYAQAEQLAVMKVQGERRLLAAPAPPPEHTFDVFTEYTTNPLQLTAQQPVSTFSSDVDTASYSYVRSVLNQGYLPQKHAVRLEEMVNYFDYAYPMPSDPNQPFSIATAVHPAPWAQDRHLVHIGIQGYVDQQAEQPDSNLVFLLDVSGSMSAENKLPLVQKSIRLLLDNLKPTDTVAIVVYASASGVVLPPTQVADEMAILNAIEQLQAGGSTAGGEGIQLAYKLAEQNFKADAVNRVILATDGDFNVGVTDPSQLETLIVKQRKKGIYLSVLGFGRGNYQEHLMQRIAQKGNGIAAYIDSLAEAQKVLVDEASANLYPIANDLKIQVEFNPAVVQEYRLLGYETRVLEREDFNNDNVDAGDIGTGHSVTAIYEVTLVGAENPSIDPLRYQNASETHNNDVNGELAFIKMRYKLPGETESQLISQAITPDNTLDQLPATLADDIRFATAVAGFAQLLTEAKHTRQWQMQDAHLLATNTRGHDPYGYRSEFVQLIRKAELAQTHEF